MADNDKTIGGRRGRGNTDPHSTGKASRSADPHSTGKASRSADPHSTGKASRSADPHSTGKASRSADPHSTGKASRSADPHSTGKASRSADPHSTGKASRSTDEHATAKGARGNDEHSTASARPFEQRGNDARMNLTENASSSTGMEWPEEFILEGVKYHNDGVLSDSSGEAIVFTVSRGKKKYALKVYYYDPEHRPNHEVLEKIRQLGGSGLLVNIVSHGEWTDPANEGRKLDYELMDFCEGGSLDGEIIRDEKKLGEVAVRIASAIDFLSKHGIIHRDIKPANFFFADKERTQIVLADFGISMECPPGGFVKIDEMRSPVYAAPEFYTNVPGEPAEVGVESDYYSLGVSLLCLWMGKAQLTANESQLLRYKLKENLPMPSDLSPHTTSLLKALTRLNMSDRATFEDIKRWVRGEILDSGSRGVRSDFYIVFNSAKNKVAHSPEELAQLLVEDKELGIRYLYSGRVIKWLDELEMNEISVIIEEIVEEIYPDNEEACLMSVAYLLDPSMDYIDPTGDWLSDLKVIAKQLMEAPGTMAAEVTNPDSNLMLYLKAKKKDKTIATIQEYVNSEEYVFDENAPNVNNYIACVYLALLLDPTLPIQMSTDEGWTEVNDVDQMMKLFRDEGDIDFINKGILCSPALIVWLSSRNPALAGKVRMLHDKATLDDPDSMYYAADFPYRIAYELAPEADFNFETDPDAPNRVYTVKEIGGYLNEMLSSLATGKNDEETFDSVFVNMDSNAVGQYLRARGEEYAKYLNWNRYCMNVDSEENRQKAGPYDPVIGAYRSVAGFIGKTPYYTIGEHTFDTLEGMKKVPRSELVDELGGYERQMPDGGDYAVPWLDAWLTTLFQENPKLDLSPKFTYEKKTAEYIEEISKIDPNNYYAERYNSAIKQIDDAAKSIKKNDSKIKNNRILYLLAGGIPTLLMLIGSFFFDVPAVNPIKGHFWYTVLICAIGCFVVCYSQTRFSGALLDGAVGGLILATIVYAGFAWFPSVFCMICWCLLIIFALLAIRSMSVRNRVDTGGVDISGEDFHFRQLDALYYTFCQKNDDLESAVTKYSRVQGKYDSDASDNIVGTGWMWIGIVWMMLALWFFVTPQLSGKYSWANGTVAEKTMPGSWVLGTWDARYTGGSTRIVSNIDSVAENGNIYGTMVIAGQAPVAATGAVMSGKDNTPESFIFRVADGDGQRQRITAEYDAASKTMKGYYYDRKKVQHDVTFTATPLPVETTEGKTEEKPAKTTAPTRKVSAEPRETAAKPAAEEKSTSILPVLPGWETESPAEETPAQVAEEVKEVQQEVVQEVKEEAPQEAPKVPDSRATRQKLQTPNR